MPRHHIERCMILLSSEQMAGKLGRQCPLRIRILIKVGHRCLEVSRVSQAVGSDWPEFRECEVSLIQFKDITSDWTLWEIDTVSDSSWDDTDLIWPHEDSSELGSDFQRSMLRDDQEVTVCTVEGLMCIHVLSGCVYVDADTRFHAWISSSSNQMKAVDPVYCLVQIEGIPSELIGNLMDLLSWLIFRVCIESGVFSWFEIRMS